MKSFPQMKPRRGIVLVTINELPEQTPGGIFLCPTARIQTGWPKIGTIRAVNDQDDPGFAVGDEVVVTDPGFRHYWNPGDTSHLFVSINDIAAVMS